MQARRPIAFLSKALKGGVLLLSTYENELLSLVTAVQKWRPYLVGHSFIVCIDYQALKFLLEQQVGNVAQQRWLSKNLVTTLSLNSKKAGITKSPTPYLGKPNVIRSRLNSLFP
jgi:hypothetical protein